MELTPRERDRRSHVRSPQQRRLFEDDATVPRELALAPGAVLLGGFARPHEATLALALHQIVEAAPFRHMVTPGGRPMSVAITSCGRVGWITDRSGYRYAAHDPTSDRPWPAMPAAFATLAAQAAERAGFAGFAPDACLINRYEIDARLSLHQDKDERDFTAPIVSVSLGLPAVFLFGGLRRADPARRVALEHGDVVVFGGPSRLRYHGVLAVAPGHHPLMGACRINLTFRKAL
jgi:alkylated DNA repair protein (DNA oxidative demethylase)